jgi:hypothetical protein
MEVTMNRIPLALVLGLAAGMAGPAAAQQAKPGAPAAKAEASPAEAYTARKASAMILIGSKLESPASFAWSNDLRQTALDVYRQILEYDPENRKAKEQLGFEKKEGGWVANEGKQAKLKELEDGSKGEKKRPEFEKKLKDAQKEAAKLLAELGNLAAAAGDEDGAKGHWKATLVLDDQNPLANEKMGNKIVDGKWFTGRALSHKSFEKIYKSSLAKAQAMTVAPVSCEDSTKICESASLPVKRYKTKNFRIESTLSDAEIRDTLVWLERSRQYFLDLFDVPERMLDYAANPCVFIIVSTTEQHDKVIDACPLVPAAKKSWEKKFGGNIYGKLIISTAPNTETAQRFAIHSATHAYVGDAFGVHSIWLREALANSVSAAIKGADLTVCYSGDGSTAGATTERMGLEQAPTTLRELVLEKKDTPMAEFVKLPSDAMTPQTIAKAWSIVMFLLEMDREKARGYFEAAGQGGDGEKSKDDKVLKQFFPDFETWAGLDSVWREWAVDVYKP